MLIVLLICVAAPLAFDGVRVCVANWMSMNGQYMEAETPAFDLVVESHRQLRREVWGLFGPVVREPPWKAGSTITIAATWALAMAWMFRSKS